MASSQNDVSDGQRAPESIQRKADTYEDEIDLANYLRVLWKRKCFIAFGSILPALVFGLVIFFWPRDYKVIYTYDMNLGEKDYKTLLDGFHSAENSDRIISKLRENGLSKYARRVAGATGDEARRKSVTFEVQTTEQDGGALLTMTVVGQPKSDMEKISLIIRDNFEKVVPMYSVKQALNNAIIGSKNNMVFLERARFDQELGLEKEKAILTKLRSLEPEDSNKIASDIILQLNNVRDNSAYLPLAYQIRAAQSNIINFEETMSMKEREYEHLKSLLNLNERLLDEVERKASSHYTIQEFHPLLTSIVSDYEDKGLIDYLSSYIKEIENTISRNTPIMGEPNVYPLPKGTVKKTAIVFAVLLVIATFAAFLFEAVQKRQLQPS